MSHHPTHDLQEPEELLQGRIHHVQMALLLARAEAEAGQECKLNNLVQQLNELQAQLALRQVGVDRAE